MDAAQKIVNGDLGQQNDPLRSVFGIWGRLLNRMAQKSPPSDDELHLKGAQEDNREDGNVIGEDPEGLNFPPRGGFFGGGSAKSFGGGTVRAAPVGPNRIIDEQRLNELLPRLNPNAKEEEKQAPTTTTRETIQLRTSTDEKKKGQLELIKECELGLNETVERAENETAQLIAEIENVLADAEMGPNGHWLRQQAGEGNTTRTSAKEEQEESSYEEEIDEGAGKGKEESYESDDSEEESKVKEAEEEIGGGQAGKTVQQNTTMEVTTATMSTDIGKENVTLETGTSSSTTVSTSTITETSSEVTQKRNGTKKWIPEAEEEDQHQQQQQIAAQLQLDSAVTVSSSTPPTSSSTQQSPQSAQNIFNLNANSNSYANPNLHQRDETRQFDYCTGLISGSSPPGAELAFFPPNLPSQGPSNPSDQPIPVRPTLEQKSDRGYDTGRQTVQSAFHEDSGLMLGTHQTQSHPQPPGSVSSAAAGFGNGKKPNEPFGFTRR
uniref:Uncharacterized protein n=1 Tax=Globodera pallida TaxID=36090 RepID=A0A183CBA1_GLOPA